MIHALIVASALITCGISTFLVFSCEYEDGFFGRIALVLISVSQAIVAMDGLQGSDYGNVLMTTLVLQLGVALFFMRHIYRFLRWQRHGDYDWRPARK